MLEKEDYLTLIQICKDWGFEYGCKNTSDEVSAIQGKLEKIYRDKFGV